LELIGNHWKSLEAVGFHILGKIIVWNRAGGARRAAPANPRVLAGKSHPLPTALILFFVHAFIFLKVIGIDWN